MVVAEGIEHSEQLDQLEQLGITVGQGFLLGRPGSLPGQEAPTVSREAMPIGDEREDDGSPAMSAWRQSIGLPLA
jgi:predicted signal transduction protein with EAL and GGDEF domain